MKLAELTAFLDSELDLAGFDRNDFFANMGKQRNKWQQYQCGKYIE